MDLSENYNKISRQNINPREVELLQELAKIKRENKSVLEFEDLEGYELPPRTQFSMLKKPALTFKFRQMTFNTAAIRLFEGIEYIMPIIHPEKKRIAAVMCNEEESASVQWSRQRIEDAVWSNRQITSEEFIMKIYQMMGWNYECRYKILGRVANSSTGLILLFDLKNSIMFAPEKHEFTDPMTGKIKKREIKYYPDEYRERIGKSFNDYVATRQLNLFEDFQGYQGDIPQDMTFGKEEQNTAFLMFYDFWKMQEVKELAEQVGFKQLRLGCWNKTNPVPINSKINYLSNAKEFFVSFVKKSKPTFNSEYDNAEYYCREEECDTYFYPIVHGKERLKHPTQKPLKLIENLVNKHSNEGDWVLDFFAGTGTTGEACQNLNRNCTLCEIDKVYYDLIEKRLSKNN